MTFRLVIIWLIIAVGLTTISYGKEEELSEYVVSECYGDIFNFDCGRGNKIRINKDFFGYSKSRTCRYGQGECIISNPKSNSLIHRFCTGHRVCTYYLVERRGCGGSFSNYQQVEYQCIPDSMVTDICSTVDYKASSTYIASPNFPENYPPKLNCRCMVSATSPKAKVRMEIVYLAIKYTYPCRDWLSIGMRRTCGTTMDLFQGRRIPIEFNSDDDDSHSGFWLHFKSSVPGEQVHVQCGNITFRPFKKPDIHHERVSGSEGGEDSSESDPDAIYRSPRPEDVPEERPLDASGKVKKPPRTNSAQDIEMDSHDIPGIGDDPASGKGRPLPTTTSKPRTTTVGFLSSSNLEEAATRRTSTDVTGDLNKNGKVARTSQAPKIIMRTNPDSISDIYEVGGHEGLPIDQDAQETNTRGATGQERKVPEDIFDGAKNIGNKEGTAENGNSDKTNFSVGISTQATPDTHKDENISPPTFHDISRHDVRNSHNNNVNNDFNSNDGDTTNNNNYNNNKHNETISKLDDEVIWGKPAPDNDLTKGDKVLLENNSYSDDKSQLNIDTSLDGDSYDPGRMSGSGNPDERIKTSGLSTTGIIIVSICVGVGLLLVCAVLLIVYFKRHGTRDEETQTPRQKPASDGDSGQGLLVTGSSKPTNNYDKVDKSLQIDLDSDYEDHITFSAHLSAMNALEEGDESSLYSGLYSDPNCKGVQVTTNSIAKARFRDKKRKRTKMLIGKSSSSGIDVKGCDSLETTEGSSSETGKPPFRPISDFSDPGSFTCSEPEMGLEHKRSLASMSQYSEVTLMPENAVLPTNNEFYDSFSDPEWDQKSAISI